MIRDRDNPGGPDRPFGAINAALLTAIVFIAGLLVGVGLGGAGDQYTPYTNYTGYDTGVPGSDADGTTPGQASGVPRGGDTVLPGQSTLSDLTFNPPSVNVGDVTVPGSWESLASLIVDYVGGTAYKAGGMRYIAVETDIAVALPESMEVPASAGPGGMASPVPGYFEDGNFQVTGVRELDAAAFNGTHIILAERDMLSVYRVYPPSSLDLVASLNMSSVMASYAPDVEVRVIVDGVEQVNVSYGKRVTLQGILLSGDRIIAIGQVTYTAGSLASMRLDVAGAIAYFEPGSVYTPLVVAAVLDSGLNVIEVYTVNGYLEDARLAGGKLALTARMPSYMAGYGAVVPLQPIVNGRPLPADSIAVAGEPEGYLTVLAVNVTSLEYSALSILGPFGYGYTVMDPTGLVYIAFNGYGTVNGVTGQTVTVYTVNADPNGVTLLARGAFEGWIRSPWQLQPYDGYLILLTGGLTVDVYILDPDTLKPAASLEDLSVREQVYGVRIVDGILYMVTFRQVDPLFAINITDPSNPVVLGYLKAPGFDNYLHPVGDGLLLGVGVEDGVVRISLYKLANGTPTPVDRVYTVYTHTLLLEPMGHKSFAFNSMLGIALIPVMYPLDSSPIGGYLVVKVENNTLSLIGVLSHDCASRAYTAETYAYTVSAGHPIGPILYEYTEEAGQCPVITAWSLEAMEEIGSVTG